jgi:putative ABC transport system permease protein
MRTNQAGTSFISAGRQLGEAWREGARSFEVVALYSSKDVTLTGGDEPEETTAGKIDERVPEVLGVTPLIGRAFTAEDMVPGAAPVAVLSQGLWRRRYGSDPSVLGQAIAIDGQPHTIVGVVPRDFNIPFLRNAPRQVWLPLARDSSTFPMVLGRMREGVTRDAAVAELDGVMRALDEPRLKMWRSAVTTPADYLGRTTIQTLYLLLGAVIVVLLIACVNVANLLLARATARQREFAVRTALGAGRGRLVRQLLTESAILALAGGTAGLVLARVGLALIVRYRPGALAALDDVTLAPGIIALSLALALVTGIVFGLAPAWWASMDMRQAARAITAGRLAQRARATLVVAEVSLSVVLLVGDGLLIRTLLRMQQAPLGFSPAGLVSASVYLPEDRFVSAAQRWATWEQLRERVRTIPGVQEVTWSEGVPSRSGVAFGSLEVSGKGKVGEGTSMFGYNSVLPGFTSMVGLTLREGTEPVRGSSTPNEIMVNERLAAELWPGVSAIGGRFRLAADAEWYPVTGVVSDVTMPRLGAGVEPFDRMIYASFDGARAEAVLLMRIAGDGSDLLGSLTRHAAAIHPAIKVRNMVRVSDQIAGDLARPRFNSLLLSVFAGLAALLAAVGLYGVIAYAVSQRLREMGIRLALGARQGQVRAQVLSSGVGLAGMGVLIGLVGAAALSRVMRGMLFGVDPIDPATFAVVGLAIGTVALGAAWIPAHRATRVDPAVTLRED